MHSNQNVSIKWRRKRWFLEHLIFKQRPPHDLGFGILQQSLSFPSHSWGNKKLLRPSLGEKPSHGSRQHFMNGNSCSVPLSDAWFGSANN